MPGLKVGAHRPLALAALVDGDGGVVGHLEERNDPLALAIGALNERAGGADVGPVVTEAARPLGELGIVADALENMVEVVHDRRQVAGAELRMQGAAIEESRRGGGEEEAREEFVELDGPLVLLAPLIEREAKADAHPEELGRLDTATTDVDQVAIIDGLQSHVVEQEVTLGPEGGGDLLQIKLQKRGGETASSDPLLEVGLEPCRVGNGDIVVVFESGKRLAVDHIEKEARGDVAVGRILLDAGLGGEDHRLLDLIDADTVVKTPHRLIGHLTGLTAVLKPAAGTDQGAADTLGLQDLLASVTEGDMKLCLNMTGKIAVSAQGTGLAAILTINDVPASHLDVALHHESLLHGILDTLDLEFFATGGTTEEALDDSGCHGKSRGLILWGKRIVAGNIPVCLEGAFDGKANSLLIEGLATTIALANGEFTTLKGVDSAQGELAGEWFHGFRERLRGFWEKVHKNTICCVSWIGRPQFVGQTATSGQRDL